MSKGRVTYLQKDRVNSFKLPCDLIFRELVDLASVKLIETQFEGKPFFILPIKDAEDREAVLNGGDLLAVPKAHYLEHKQSYFR